MPRRRLRARPGASGDQEAVAGKMAQAAPRGKASAPGRDRGTKVPGACSVKDRDPGQRRGSRRGGLDKLFELDGNRVVKEPPIRTRLAPEAVRTDSLVAKQAGRGLRREFEACMALTLDDIVRFSNHVVRGGDHLGIRLVSALAHDHVDHFLHNAHIGLLNKPGKQGA